MLSCVRTVVETRVYRHGLHQSLRCGGLCAFFNRIMGGNGVA
jgi:hypothetical protein